MLGFYDYTVWLTYISLLSAGTGIIVSLNGSGHPYLGMFFLMVCGFCDAFDGRVARTKKNRTEMEVNYGIQIDSLSDLVAFGVLPACIGNALVHSFPAVTAVMHGDAANMGTFVKEVISILILILYMLAALIRLAYFNVTEEERQKAEGGCRKFYEGLPVTSASLIFPILLTMKYFLPWNIIPIYFGVMVLTGLGFLSKIKIPKPGLRGILIMIGVGVLDFVAWLILHWYFG